MANLLNKFSKKSVAANTYLIDYSSKIHPSGDFERIEKLNVIITSWLNILMTSVGTVDHDPEFGCGLHKYLFKPADSSTLSSIKTEIMTSLLKYDDRASIDNIIVKAVKEKKAVYIEIYVSYEGVRGQLSVVSTEDSVYSVLKG